MDNNTAAKWLDDLAIYFERRDTHGEDKAFWANVYNAESVRKIKAALSAAEARIERLEAALNERDLFSNPDLLEKAADEIDCGADCEEVWREYDTNASGCRAYEAGKFCPNDIAETLRSVAKVARAALEGETK